MKDYVTLAPYKIAAASHKFVRGGSFIMLTRGGTILKHCPARVRPGVGASPNVPVVRLLWAMYCIPSSCLF